MIDIHAHILPFLDDGPSNLDESVKMAVQAYHEGVQAIIATPHHLTSKYYNDCDAVEQSVRTLNERLQEEGIAVKIMPGQEVRINRIFFREWEKGNVLTLNHSRYMLIEFEGGVSYDQMLEWVHELRMLDLVPIIAHPERIPAVIDEPERIHELIQSGALCQATCLTIEGQFGRKVQKTAEKLCKLGGIHLLASDAHDSLKRTFYWKLANEKLEKWMGSGWQSYVLQNAERVVHDQWIDVSTSGFSQRRKFALFRK